MIPKVPHPSVIIGQVCSVHSLTRPQWVGAPVPHSRRLLYHPVSWLPSLHVPVSLPHVSIYVSRTPSKNNLYPLKPLCQSLLLGKPNLRPGGVVGGVNLGSAPSICLAVLL